MTNSLFNFNGVDHAFLSPRQSSSAPYSFLSELGQQSHLSYSVVKHLLNSRRLLIDHVECLENCLVEVELGIPKTELFTLTNLSLIGSVALLLNVAENVMEPIKYTATSIASIYGALFFCKYARKFRNKAATKNVEALVRNIENFGNGVKKNVSYFNELAFMKNGGVPIEDLHYKRAWGCIQAIKIITECLFDATRQLETNFPLPLQYNDLYVPMEDLKTCEYFTRQLIEYNPRHIKDFYNIFAYVQSQFLLRFGLSVAENSSMNFLRNDVSKLNKKIKKILTDEEYCFTKISSALKRRRSRDRPKLRKGDLRSFAPVAILKDTSIKLTSSIIAVAEECEKLDNAMQNILIEDDDDTEDILSNSDKKTQLISMAETMRTIELSLSTCNDDFQRLILIYNRFIGNKLRTRSNSLSRSDTSDTYEHLQSLSLRDVEIDENLDDDYFAYAYDERADEDANDNQKYTDYELHNLDRKVSKKRFQPVLKQLRTKIEPIRKELQEKELRILEAKGVDIEKFFGKECGKGDSPRSSRSYSESDSDESIQRNERQIRTDNYGELREFLAQKSPINLFNLPQPTSKLFEEDIIE